MTVKQVRRIKNKLDGWLVLDKPLELSSNQLLGQVKRLLSPEKVGFAGTLDPLATGVLPIAFGEATKTIPYMMDDEKIYEFSMRWGEETDTLDREGEIIKTSEVRPSSQEIKIALKQFLGVILQIPPKYSAVKIDGKRAYKRARSGETFKMKAKKIEIFAFEFLGDEGGSESAFRVTCSKGTYIRSLARDLAYALGSVGHVSKLRRTKVGVFDLSCTISLDLLEKMIQNSSNKLLPVVTALDDISAYALLEEDAERLKLGQYLFPSQPCESFLEPPTYYKGMLDDQLVAILMWDMTLGGFKPKRVFNIETNKGE